MESENRPNFWLRTLRRLRRAATLLLAVGATLLVVRVVDSFRGPSLEAWHRTAPAELSVRELDRTDWAGYLAAESEAFDEVRRDVTERLDEAAMVPLNRYWSQSAIYTPAFAHDWNRSFLAVPEPDRDGWHGGPPIGSAVFLHGLTDSPYSLRHIAADYRRRGFVTVAIRLPGHGTVPAGLTTAIGEQWMAATRLAVREAVERGGPDGQLHVVGFSLGGALAVKYALEAIEDESLAMPDRLVLISPMIGITRFARFAGLAGLPAVLPPFAKAAWLGILPEFNPFKYNSFPVNAARQAHRTSVALQREVIRLANDGLLTRMPPTITFQSVMDSTVSTAAVLAALYAHLPENGSELVLFDVNRTIKFEPLLRPGSATAIERLAPKPPLRYRLTLVGNDPDDPTDTRERSFPVGSDGSAERTEVRRLGVEYPSQLFSLSHVALPFPLDDPLYGINPTPDEDFGVRLGSIEARGERGALIVHLDAIFRIASNPFLPYMLERIAALDGRAVGEP